MRNILERLKRLEMSAKALFVSMFPDDSDNFVGALVGDRAEQYRRDTGFDVMAALNDTAGEDWADFEQPEEPENI